MKKHQKHTALARPSLGSFGRNEWGIIGAPCGKIQSLAGQIISALSQNWKLAYVDADHASHASADKKTANGKAEKPMLAHGAVLEYTNKITHHRFDLTGEMGQFHMRPKFNGMDGVIVNGNHFKAKSQIIVIDPKKEGSLRRKLDRLTDVQLFLLTEGMDGPFDFLKKEIENMAEVPTFRIDDTQSILSFFEKKLSGAKPKLRGLVLAGGKSQRMGKDKSLLDFHGQPQRLHMAGLLSKFCDSTYLSCRADQVEEMAGPFPTLPDTFLGLGPMGAILSAFRAGPDAAWLVVACDLPLLDHATLGFLTKNRNTSKMATSFLSPVTGFPEPLIAIWEPRAYPVLLNFLSQGYSCPRKALINSPIELLTVPDAQALRNVNTPEDLAEVRGMMGF